MSDTAPTNKDALLHNAPKPAPRQAKPGELLWAFVRARDHKRFHCELRFHGPSYGWEAQFFEGGEMFAGRGAFATRAQAVQWATLVRSDYEHDRP